MSFSKRKLQKSAMQNAIDNVLGTYNIKYVKKDAVYGQCIHKTHSRDLNV